MRCVELVERVTDLAEGRLPAAARLRVRLHLLVCLACRAYRRQMRDTARLLGRLPRTTPPADSARELVRRFRLGASETSEGRSPEA